MTVKVIDFRPNRRHKVPPGPWSIRQGGVLAGNAGGFWPGASRWPRSQPRPQPRRRSTPRRRRRRVSTTSSTERPRARTRRSTSGSSPSGTAGAVGHAGPGDAGRRPRARSASGPRRSAPTGTRRSPFGDTVFRIQYQIENTPTVDAQRRHHGPRAVLRLHGRDTNAVLAQKPTGFNYDVCGGRARVLQPHDAGREHDLQLGRRAGPFPPASNASTRRSSTRAATARARRPHNVYNVNGTNGQPLTVNGNANNHQHWTQVYCGHEIQINESLNGGGPNPSTDPIKTGSVYGFRNLNAQQSGTYERLTKGVWHQYEIRTIGQQYTIMIDGKIINQFDNSIPKINTRSGRRADDGAPVHAGLPRPADPRRHRPHLLPRDPGQGHRAGRHPGQHRRAVGHGLGLPGQPADLQPRHVEHRRRHDVLRQVVPLEQDPADATRASAPRARPTTGTTPRRPTRPTARRR